jgi:hypothetical protein
VAVPALGRGSEVMVPSSSIPGHEPGTGFKPANAHRIGEPQCGDAVDVIHAHRLPGNCLMTAQPPKLFIMRHHSSWAGRTGPPVVVAGAVEPSVLAVEVLLPAVHHAHLKGADRTSDFSAAGDDDDDDDDES